MEAYKLIFEKKLVNSHITDIVLKAFRKERIETENYYHLQFATTDEILKRNIPSKLQHIKVDKWLSSAETFTKRNTPGCYDALFGF
jgi:predicted polyphosphate/ATP-dependent NAD kinase